MATYKEIKGVTVQALDEDPVTSGGSWSSGGNMNTARRGNPNPAGIQTAGLAIGGFVPPYSALTENYNGSSWTETGDLNVAKRGMGSFGSSTAALVAGGYGSPTNLATAETFDGSSWTEVGDLNSARNSLSAAGYSPQTAGVVFGGVSPSAYQSITESWNGSAWTETGDMNTARGYLMGAGISTSGMAIGGNAPPYPSPGKSALAEAFNGSSWTETGDLNTARSHGASGGATNTQALLFGGDPSTAKTESWDGSSWTEVSDLSASVLENGGLGTYTSALSFGGNTGSVTAATEEWSFPPPTAAILTEGDVFLSGGIALKGFGKAAGIPTATFASGGSLNTARGYHGGAGTDHEALLAFGGTTGTAVNNVEQYNGSSWSEVAEINTTRANLTGFGSSTAAIAGNGSTPTKVETESWNGSAWSEIAELNFSRSDSASAGTQTSGMVATGTPVPGNPSLQPGGSSIVTETWDGTSWTEVGDTNTQRLQAGMAMGGSVTAGIIAAGEDGPGSHTLNAETWNGTSWTEVGNISQQRGSVYNFMGNSSSANIAGGYSGTARVANNEHWNGSSWTEINDLSTARNAAFGAGSAVNGAVFGGDTGPSYQSATEEFIADNALSTVTVS